MNRTLDEICDNSDRDPQNVRDKHTFHGLVNQEDCLGTLHEERKITELWGPRADADDDDEAIPTGHGRRRSS